VVERGAGSSVGSPCSVVGLCSAVGPCKGLLTGACGDHEGNLDVLHCPTATWRVMLGPVVVVPSTDYIQS